MNQPAQTLSFSELINVNKTQGNSPSYSTGCSQSTWRGWSTETINEGETKCSESLWMTLERGRGVKKKKKRVLKFFFFAPLLLHSPKMNWLFRFKKVHGWNTKRGSSISPWIVRENPVAVWREGRRGEGREAKGRGGGDALLGLWLDPGPVLLRGSEQKHQSSLLPLQILWTTWDNFFTVSPLFKDFLYQARQRTVCVNEHSLLLGCLLC